MLKSLPCFSPSLEATWCIHSNAAVQCMWVGQSETESSIKYLRFVVCMWIVVSFLFVFDFCFGQFCVYPACCHGTATLPAIHQVHQCLFLNVTRSLSPLPCFSDTRLSSTFASVVHSCDMHFIFSVLLCYKTNLNYFLYRKMSIVPIGTQLCP